MARFDRCSVCDYSEADGSSLAGVRSGKNGKVRRYTHDYLCDTCHFHVVDTYKELTEETDAEEG